METNAVRNAVSLNNIPNRNLTGVAESNGKNTGFCYRCGKSDHLLRDCPLPFTRILAYAPRKGQGKGNAMVATGSSPEALPDIISGAFNSSGKDLNSTSEQQAEISPLNPQCEESNTTAISDGEWMELWLKDTLMTSHEFINNNRCQVREEVNHQVFTVSDEFVDLGASAFYLPNDCGIAKASHNRLDVGDLIVDSGATATVAGLKWMRKWLKDNNKTRPQLSESNKCFRFGDSRKFNSLGKAIFSGYSPLGNDSLRVTAKLNFEIDLVSADIPLLISRRS